MFAKHIFSKERLPRRCSQQGYGTKGFLCLNAIEFLSCPSSLAVAKDGVLFVIPLRFVLETKKEEEANGTLERCLTLQTL